VIALDPSAPANRAIVDLDKAPRDPRGFVTYSSEFLLLRPVSAAARSGTLLYEVNNRGGIGILGQLGGRSPAHNDPTTRADAGNGFLFESGFSLLWSAWAWDAQPGQNGDRPFKLDPPVATDNGRPITGAVTNEFTVSAPAETAEFTGLRGVPYPLAIEDDPAAVLSERDGPDAPRRAVARARWSFVHQPGEATPTRVRLDGGFRPGVLYDVTYRARDPVVVGAGLAAIRDLLSWFRDHPFEGQPPPARTLIFGISQSGRVIDTMLLKGLNVDERGRGVFDGAFIHVAGAGKGSFDHRFAMPTRHFSLLEEHDYPTDYFPFTTAQEREPLTGQAGSLLDADRSLGVTPPRLFFVNTSTEYWNRSASLITTDPAGRRDIAPAANARVYLLAGSQHYVGRSKTRAPYVNCVSTTNHYPVMRALLLDLQRWVAEDRPPPPSAYPTIASRELISAQAYRAAFPALPSLTAPVTNLKPPRLDLGPRFWREGIADRIPPRHLAPFNTLVPAPDRDGNDRSGIRQVELQVPLGTHTGWNQRAPETGFGWATARFDGSFVPFARTEAERRRLRDPRPSLQARYRSRADFEAKLRAAAERDVAAGFLRREEVGDIVAAQGALYDRIMAHDPDDRSCTYLFAE
jgi:hypothetical protein